MGRVDGLADEVRGEGDAGAEVDGEDGGGVGDGELVDFKIAGGEGVVAVCPFYGAGGAE